jgi:hypothetical protein
VIPPPPIAPKRKHVRRVISLFCWGNRFLGESITSSFKSSFLALPLSSLPALFLFGGVIPALLKAAFFAACHQGSVNRVLDGYVEGVMLSLFDVSNRP